jgi:hypothetical protein
MSKWTASETGEAPHRHALPARVTGREGYCRAGLNRGPAAAVHRIMLQRGNSRRYRILIRLLVLQAS